MRCSNEELIIYRERTGVVVYVLLLAITSLGFGAAFIYLDHENLFVILLGGLFCLVGTLIIAGLPGHLRKMKTYGGDLLLKANKHTLSVTPMLKRSVFRGPTLTKSLSPANLSTKI